LKFLLVCGIINNYGVVNINNKLKGNILLTTTALIWGMAFVAQAKGIEHIGPFTFNGLRAFIAGIVLAVVIIFRNIFSKDKSSIIKMSLRTILTAGITCGIVLFFGTITQQLGLVSTTAGKGGFITALYIIFVPIFGLFIKKKVPYYVYISVVIALLGMYLLCFKDDFSVNIGGNNYILSCGNQSESVDN